jgi:hypothetical protein
MDTNYLFVVAQQPKRKRHSERERERERKEIRTKQD